MWKTISETHYEVSETGQVRNIRTGRILKPQEHNGYLYVNLNGHNRRIHRLVLETYKPCDGMDAMHADHINFIRGDNRVENLRWLTAAESRRRQKHTRCK